MNLKKSPIAILINSTLIYRAVYYQSGQGQRIDRHDDYVPEKWVRLTVVGKARAQELKIYLNGIGGGETPRTIDSGTRAAKNGHVVLGRRYVSNPGNWATFIMDDLIIWDEALPENLVKMIL